MEQRQSFRITDWVGLNTRLSDLEIPIGASPALNNIEFFKEGWTIRNGITKKNASAIASKAVTGLFDGFNDVLAYCDTKLKQWNSGTSAWDDAITGLTADAIPVFASYNALDLMVNGSGNDAPQKWNGTTGGAIGGSPPKADDIVVWRNHVWYTGLASPNQGEVQFSEIEDPESYPGNFLRPTKRVVTSFVLQRGRKVVTLFAVVWLPSQERRTAHD
jgi:hypothetical protein